jgi:hypothetical protein
MAVIMKNAVFWDVTPRRSCVNRRFGGIIQCSALGRRYVPPERQLTRDIHIPEDGIHQTDSRSHDQEILRDYVTQRFIIVFTRARHCALS